MLLQLAAVLSLLISVCAAQETCSMTPSSFQQDFIDSCRSLSLSMDACMTAWGHLRDAFAGMPPEEVTASSYEPYFDFLPIEAMADQSLFWTRTSSLVDILSMMNAMGVNIVSSFNTVSSSIINGISVPSGSLNWCGNESGIDFVNPCLCNVTGRFWYQYSAEFGIAAEGNTFYLADGEDSDGAFRDNSFFSTVELPNMRDDAVTHLVALVVHREGIGESCSEGSSVQRLRDRVSNRSFSFDCYDIFAEANNVETTRSTANCLRNVIDDVQMDTEGSERQIQCDGSPALRMSILGLLISLCLGLFFRMS